MIGGGGAAWARIRGLGADLLLAESIEPSTPDVYAAISALGRKRNDESCAWYLPRTARPYQQTKALPAFLHFYGKTYDPLIDTPYNTEFDLFGQASAAGEGGEGGGN